MFHFRWDSPDSCIHTVHLYCYSAHLGSSCAILQNIHQRLDYDNCNTTIQEIRRQITRRRLKKASIGGVREGPRYFIIKDEGKVKQNSKDWANSWEEGWVKYKKKCKSNDEHSINWSVMWSGPSKPRSIEYGLQSTNAQTALPKQSGRVAFQVLFSVQCKDLSPDSR